MSKVSFALIHWQKKILSFFSVFLFSLLFFDTEKNISTQTMRNEIYFFLFFQKRTSISENPSVPHESHRCTDFAKIVFKETLEVSGGLSSSPPREGLFRFSGMKMQQLLAASEGKFTTFNVFDMRIDTRNNAECFKTKIIDFESLLFFLFLTVTFFH
jgi:hypothetical protein